MLVNALARVPLTRKGSKMPTISVLKGRRTPLGEPYTTPYILLEGSIYKPPTNPFKGRHIVLGSCHTLIGPSPPNVPLPGLGYARATAGAPRHGGWLPPLVARVPIYRGLT